MPRFADGLTGTVLQACGGQRGIALALAVLTLAACSGTLLEKARKLPATGDAYTRTLAKAYMKLSKAEYGEGDYADSDYFADRAMRAAQNQRFGPQELSDRDLKSSHANELGPARVRLIEAMESGSADTAPENTALALAAFECWMQEAEEDRQPRDIRECRDEFETAMAAIEIREAPPAPAKLAPGPAEPLGVYTVFFDLGSDRITPEAKDVLVQLAEDARRLGATRIIVEGHTDTSGSASTNLALSERRAVNALKALKPLVPVKDLRAAGLGETKPARQTGDGIREVLNRRAHIIVF